MPIRALIITKKIPSAHLSKTKMFQLNKNHSEKFTRLRVKRTGKRYLRSDIYKL